VHSSLVKSYAGETYFGFDFLEIKGIEEIIEIEE
jgi:hypothetical protein